MSKALAPKQGAYLEYLIDYTLKHGYMPSIREIGDHFGVSTLHNVNRHLWALEAKDYIEREAGLSRAIKITRFPDGSKVKLVFVPDDDARE